MIQINAYSVGVQQLCSEGKFFNEDTEQCESCAECTHAQFERCILKRYRSSGDEKKFVKKFGKKFVDSIFVVDDKVIDEAWNRMEWYQVENLAESSSVIMEKIKSPVSNCNTQLKAIDVEELPDRRTLPPLPTDDEYDDEEYDDNDILAPIQLALPSSEEELIGKVEKEFEEDKVQPINVNEGKIGQDDEFSDEDNELLHHNDRISIVAIAFRNKQ
ncbi:unnamed protein product [Angiostrongylus costaricensis]|uniref:Uncharacterized protein n=1 Tax=Angiostrongylus costaricensis TaxID=334426 RepID=A0A158PGW8_ANGCS|nr:unnamed protein product [Angiostrongylus costaricensis]